MEKIIIIGGGGHSKVLISVIKKSLPFEVVGYVDFFDQGIILGATYLGDDSKLNYYFSEGISNVAIGVGQITITQKRYEIVEKIKKLGFTFPPIISRDAIVNEDVIINDGAQIFDGVVVNSGSRIGKFSIVNTKSILEHDCIIGDFCHIATGAVLSGGVEVGDFSMIGSNSVVVQYKKITANCLVGSGGVVIHDILGAGVYVGNPVRRVK